MVCPHCESTATTKRGSLTPAQWGNALDQLEIGAHYLQIRNTQLDTASDWSQPHAFTIIR
jgi:hypothetical protein